MNLQFVLGYHGKFVISSSLSFCPVWFLYFTSEKWALPLAALNLFEGILRAESRERFCDPGPSLRDAAQLRVRPFKVSRGSPRPPPEQTPVVTSKDSSSLIYIYIYIYTYIHIYIYMYIHTYIYVLTCCV